MGGRAENSSGRQLSRDTARPKMFDASPLKKVPPTYTQQAIRAKVQGWVNLRFVVGRDGIPRDFQVVKSLGFGLDEKAIEAVKKWTFRPGMRCYEPVESTVTELVVFRLPGTASATQAQASSIDAVEEAQFLTLKEAQRGAIFRALSVRAPLWFFSNAAYQTCGAGARVNVQKDWVACAHNDEVGKVTIRSATGFEFLREKDRTRVRVSFSTCRYDGPQCVPLAFPLADKVIDDVVSEFQRQIHQQAESWGCEVDVLPGGPN